MSFYLTLSSLAAKYKPAIRLSEKQRVRYGTECQKKSQICTFIRQRKLFQIRGRVLHQGWNDSNKYIIPKSLRSMLHMCRLLTGINAEGYTGGEVSVLGKNWNKLVIPETMIFFRFFFPYSTFVKQVCYYLYYHFVLRTIFVF